MRHKGIDQKWEPLAAMMREFRLSNIEQIDSECGAILIPVTGSEDGHWRKLDV
jgi:hypothetical protein